MKLLIFTALLFTSTSFAADQWWTKTSQSLPDFLGKGYTIVGFASENANDPSVMRYGTKLHYVLQKDTQAVICTELIQSGKSKKRTCFVSRNSTTQ